MKISRYSLIHAIIVFLILNFCLSLLSFVIRDCANLVMVTTGFMNGIVLGILSIVFQEKWEKFINYWQRFFAFCLVFVVMLIISVMLFNVSIVCYSLDLVIFTAIFYWLPQPILVLCMIPGAIVYYMIEYIYHKIGKGKPFENSYRVFARYK